MKRNVLLGLAGAALFAVAPAMAAEQATHGRNTPEGMALTEALNLLYAKGYHDPSNLTYEGGKVKATALDHDNKQVSVEIDPRAKTVNAM
jgi:hypothetical protein